MGFTSHSWTGNFHHTKTCWLQTVGLAVTEGLGGSPTNNVMTEALFWLSYTSLLPLAAFKVLAMSLFILMVHSLPVDV